jgi:hypothetical protein
MRILPIIAVSLTACSALAADSVTVVSRPDTSGTNRFYVANRPPLQPSPLIGLPIGAVRPEGWLRRQLELQNAGFHGHLTEISAFLKKDGNAWLDNTGKGKNGWEEVPYWLKGFQNCAYLLDDKPQLAEAREWIEGIFRSQQPDGWLGPGEGRTGVATDLKGRDDLWPNMVALFCLQSFYEQTGDARVIPTMNKYFLYLQGVPEDKFLTGYWPSMRGGDLLYSIYWLYNRTGEPWLLELAQKVHRKTARWDTDVINLHNVNVAQAFREPTVYWMQTGEPAHLDGADRNWKRMRALYGQVPGGMFGADENARPGYNGPRQAIETCGSAEEMLSDELLLGITGNPIWADRCEDVAFNSYPASFTADMKALRYLTAPNQPQSDRASKAPGIQNGGNMYEMNPNDHRCCQHNCGHGWPYFTQYAWFATPGNGLAAVLYAPCTVTARVGDGAQVKITEDTRYPFSDTITLKVALAQPTTFPLYLRIPSWCEKPVVTLNRKPMGGPVRGPGFIRLERAWAEGDTVEIRLPMEPRVRTWENNRGIAAVDRGPLTYSVKIQEDYRRSGGTDAWPAYDIFPGSPWNYALVTPASFEVVQRDWPADNQPFAADAAPVQLKTKARRVPEWTLDPRGLVREVQASPVRTTEPEETITLIPMGAARLRIAAFPVAGTGPDAHVWTTPASSPITASHCFENDSVEAVNDGSLPRNSNDQDVTRFTWWPNRGTSEWLQWTFGKPRSVAKVEVYWFDDTGRGQCRVPAECRVEYRSGTEWKPVPGAGTIGVERDQFNTVTFPPVTTDALRLVVKLRDGVSGGVLEWRVPEQ